MARNDDELTDPLAYLVGIYTDPTANIADRIAAAIAALPFFHSPALPLDASEDDDADSDVSVPGLQ